MTENNEIYWLWFSARFGVFSEKYGELLEYFDDDILKIYRLEENEVSLLEFLNVYQKKSLLDKSLDESNKILNFCQTHNVRILKYNESDFPVLLKRIRKCPPVLYTAGELPDLNGKLCIAVVGTRKMTEYGMKMAYKLSYELASSGVITVSGMALGIDGIAEAGTICAGGKTVAVLATGIDVCYPKEHERLMQNILSFGAVVTPYPPSSKAKRYTFVERNSIVSGISDGTLIIEAPEGSGALITANDAFEQSRYVFALPGNVGTKNSFGTNELIRNGAIPVTSSEDILSVFSDNGNYSIDYESLKEAKKHSEFSTNAVKQTGAYFEIGRQSFFERVFEPKEEQIQIKHIGENNDTQKTYEPKENGVDELNTLEGIERKIYLDIPLNEPVTVEKLSTLGYTAKDASVALMMLEIKGLVESLPGGAYIRK